MPLRLALASFLLACAASAQQPARAPEYEGVFDDKRVHFIHLIVEGEDWEKIGRKPFEWVKGEVEIDGERVGNVGIRQKGNSSAGIRTEKKPFKIGFAKYDKEQRFKGLRTLVLNNGFKDPTLLREKLAYDLHRAIGLPASRAAFAVVTVTARGRMEKREFGVYTIVEHVDETFLDERFGGHEGNLYKIEGMQDLFARADEVRIADEKCVELKTNEKKNDRSRFVRFAAAIADGKSDLTAWLDCDGFAKWLAATSALVNLDSYAGTGHNFYLYDDPKTGKFVLIPWDLNEAFGNFQQGPAAAHLAWDIYAPWVGSKKLIERFVAAPALRQKYLTALRDLCLKEFAPKTMAAKIDLLFKLTKEAASKDTMKEYPTDDLIKALSQDLAGARMGPKQSQIFGLKPFVERRVDSILKQLAGKAKGEKLQGGGPGPGGGPPGGGPGGKPPGPPPK
ncbi:MAG: spore coat protein [Planctomycetota bacterium]|nr:MAG: spore coat protein [Planctomycetota bacterium]